jgi:hypothetical protein
LDEEKRIILQRRNQVERKDVSIFTWSNSLAELRCVGSLFRHLLTKSTNAAVHLPFSSNSGGGSEVIQNIALKKKIKKINFLI